MGGQTYELALFCITTISSTWTFLDFCDFFFFRKRAWSGFIEDIFLSEEGMLGEDEGGREITGLRIRTVVIFLKFFY